MARVGQRLNYFDAVYTSLKITAGLERDRALVPNMQGLFKRYVLTIPHAKQT